MPLSSSSGMAGDMRALEALRGSAGRDPKAVVKEAAKQFEALFMQEIMKSMRQTAMSSGMLDNEGTKMGTDMLDTQFANQMTGLPGGLSAMIERQLQRQMGEPLANMAADVAKGAPQGSAAVASPSPDPSHNLPVVNAPSGSVKEQQLNFLRQHDGAARKAEAATGIPATFMVAQAAHESGWGRHEIKNADGSSANNLFGIKAGPGWTGPVAEVTTTEVVNGQAKKVTAKFRSYASYDESFNDYASMMKNNPRYAKVVASGNNAQGFAHGLQKAGYATDPGYADKLTRMINTTLRLQRATA